MLAADLRAAGGLPPFDASAMDGWAVRTADFGRGTTALRILETRLAGSASPRRLTAGTTIFVATGARVPAGATAVVPLEVVTRSGGRAVFSRRPARGAHIRRAGEDVRAGAVVLPAGKRLGARDLALAAGAGHDRLAVWRRPVVAILPTGDEVGKSGAGGIRDSASPALAALVEAAGGVARIQRPVADRRAAVEAAFRKAVRSSDAVISIGGVSVGPRDFAGETLRRLGSVVVSGVAVKPGKPYTAGRIGRVPVFALPGNPGSAIVTCHLFVVPALRRMAGRPPVRNRVTARLAGPLAAHPSREQYVWGFVRGTGPDHRSVRPSGPGGSHRLLPAARANALIRLPARRAAWRRGERVEVERL